MKKEGIILFVGMLLVLGFIAQVDAFSFSDFWDKITGQGITGDASKKISGEDSSSDSSSDGDSSGSDNSQRDKKGKKDSDSGESSEGDSDSNGDSSDSGGSDSKKTETDSSTSSGSTKSKEVTKTQEAYTFIDEDQNRIEVQIRTETKTKNGETYQKIKVRDVEAISNLDSLEKEGKRIKAELSNGKKADIKIMPNTASKIALSKLKSQDRTLELKEVGKGNDLSVVYFSEAEKTTKFLGLFKIRYKLSAMIDGETGEVIEFKDKPWWSFLVEEQLEEPPIENQTLQLIKPLEDIIVLKNSQTSLDLDDYFLNALEYSVSESENLTLELEGSLLTITPPINWAGTSSFPLTAKNGNESLEVLFNVIVAEENLSIQTIQYGAVVGEKVRWKKEIKAGKQKKLNVKLPQGSEDILLTKLNEEGEILSEEAVFGEEVNIKPDVLNYEIEYYTPEPKMFEKIISDRTKEITIEGVEDVHYTDILAFNYLETEANEEEIKLYHMTNKGKKEIKTNKYDLDENGLIDYIEWVVPQLSNQTYQLIIEITKADHLDENKIFVSDIYEQVNELDGVWSELINPNHYVRVEFETELTSNRDITVYARSETESSIEIYLKDSNEKIAEITGIGEAREYKTYLDGLEGSSKDFDLKVISESGIEFDLIIDPATIAITYPENTIYNEVITELNYTYANALECRYSLDGGANNVTITCGDNVTGLSANEGSNTWIIYANSTDSGLWDSSASVTFNVDTTYPETSIVYPANISYNSDVTILNYTYTETNPNKCWYSLDNGGTNSSSVSCGTNWTGLASNEGSNTWSVYINDTAGNENSTSITFFKDSLLPSINYGTGTAGDNDVVSQNFIYANVSVAEANEDTITFLLFNSTGQVDSTSYTDSTRTINWTSLTDGIYTYNVTINDTLGNSNTTSTRTITLDTDAPVITFSCDKTSVNTGETITCSCSATSATDSDPTITYTQNPSTSNTGTYTTTCTALDDAGVSASSSISYTVSSSGGGYPNYRISSDDLVDGHSRTMRKNWKMNFKVDDEAHTFLVKNIDGTGISFVLESEPQEASLSIGEDKEFELSGDNYYDLLVRLDSIEELSSFFTAEVTIQSINKEILEEVIDDKKEVEEKPETKPEEQRNLTWLWILIIILIILVLVGVGYAKYDKKKIKKLFKTFK